jgi:hypothetical protein
MTEFGSMSHLVFLLKNSEIDRRELLTDLTDRLEFTERELGSVCISPAKKTASHSNVLCIESRQRKVIEMTRMKLR